MSEATLGRLLDELGERDAIHVAIIPVIAATRLYPGSPVMIDAGTMTARTSSPDPKAIRAIADPFLKAIIEPGDIFYACLPPNTVTGMRHHWQHPAFSEQPVVEKRQKPSKEESLQWLENFCKTADCPELDILLKAATGQELTNAYPEYYDCSYQVWSYKGDEDSYLHFNGRDAHGEIPDEFWDHVENYTGMTCPARPNCFSCSC